MDDAVAVVGSSHRLIAVLDRSLQIQTGYVDHVLSQPLAELQRERDALLSGDFARRGEIVRSILGGAVPNDGLLARRLRYDIHDRHTAVIVWADDGAEADLTSVALRLASTVGAPPPLTVAAGTAMLWAWIATDSPLPVDVTGIDAPVWVAVGPPGDGVEGFRGTMPMRWRSTGCSRATRQRVGRRPTAKSR
ncbi:hypothetical protein K7711_43475 [Nocardia sp. CA2R105]|uniref:hypothetical protein n=1 Tax=Nocardia coffeae TaxID=2873381 RepID=UPI001CA6C810|nr:hypothetical protein [Nocardia coffeae]MBY8863392.1 hypothetical protein [Nocardia coffeae]